MARSTSRSATPHAGHARYPAFRSGCPVASALDLFGDRWTLVVVRTILAGRHRYNALADIPERVASNILADRLARLEAYGIVEKRAYQDNPARYEYALTRAGADLLPILQALAVWSDRHIADRWKNPDWFNNGVPADFYPEDGVTPPGK